jgi:outer membrane protein
VAHLREINRIRIPFFTLLNFIVTMACLNQAHADVDLGSVGFLSGDKDGSPIPRNFVVGAVGIFGDNRYQAQDNTQLAVPGFVYFGEKLLFLGDRGRYYFYRDSNVATFAYGRFRTGNLDSSQAPFIGLEDRQFQLEAGVGLNVITPYALLTFRAASDITGRSNGQEALAWADFPIVQDRLLIMPGCGVMWRSSAMANYYFGGISQSEGNASPTYNAYDTSSTLSPMASLVSSYRFDKNWIGMAGLSYEHYDSSIKNSPLVQHPSETYLLFGAGYTW